MIKNPSLSRLVNATLRDLKMQLKSLTDEDLDWLDGRVTTDAKQAAVDAEIKRRSEKHRVASLLSGAEVAQ